MLRMRGGLGRRLTLAFAAVAALTAGLSAAILGVTWSQQFDTYVEEGLQSSADGAASLVGRGYAIYGGWTIEAFSGLPRFGVMSGMALQVLNANGDIIYDDSYHGSFASGMIERVPTGYREPSGPVATAPIMYDSDIIGFVRVWTLSPRGLLSENDIQFQRSSFGGLAIAAITAVVMASLAGLWFARELTKPIDHITQTAEALRAGDRTARTRMQGSDAIRTLGRTFDEMADAIEADREMERRLTADVAHELRTPLQAIQATVEAMQDGVLPADEVRLGVVRDETVRLSRLADGILELTRLERGTVPMRTERLDLADPVRTAIDAHRALIEAAGLSVREEIRGGIPVIGDSDRLTQAVGNLISNAVRYTEEGGSVWVRTGIEGDRAVVEVADSGIGIAEEDLENVFRRFWRADDARDRATGGLGIGLVMVKEIVERHGGTVSATRRPEGGSSFVLRIPTAPGPTA